MRKLSKRLTLQLGKGYSLSNLHNMRRLYLYYPKCQTVSGKLSWSHWCELLEIDDSLERQFYENECLSQHWGVRSLRRQIDSGLFMRLAQSQDKKGVLTLAEKGQIIRSPQDVVKIRLAHPVVVAVSRSINCFFCSAVSLPLSIDMA